MWKRTGRNPQALRDPAASSGAWRLEQPSRRRHCRCRSSEAKADGSRSRSRSSHGLGWGWPGWGRRRGRRRDGLLRFEVTFGHGAGGLSVALAMAPPVHQWCLESHHHHTVPPARDTTSLRARGAARIAWDRAVPRSTDEAAEVQAGAAGASRCPTGPPLFSGSDKLGAARPAGQAFCPLVFLARGKRCCDATDKLRLKLNVMAVI